MSSALRIGPIGGTTALATSGLQTTAWLMTVLSMTGLAMGIQNGVLWYVPVFFQAMR